MTNIKRTFGFVIALVAMMVLAGCGTEEEDNGSPLPLVIGIVVMVTLVILTVWDTRKSRKHN